MSRYTVLKLRNVPDKQRCIRRSKPGGRIYMSELSGKTVEHCQVKKDQISSVRQSQHVYSDGRIRCYSC